MPAASKALHTFNTCVLTCGDAAQSVSCAYHSNFAVELDALFSRHPYMEFFYTGEPSDQPPLPLPMVPVNTVHRNTKVKRDCQLNIMIESRGFDYSQSDRVLFVGAHGVSGGGWCDPDSVAHDCAEIRGKCGFKAVGSVANAGGRYTLVCSDFYDASLHSMRSFFNVFDLMFAEGCMAIKVTDTTFLQNYCVLEYFRRGFRSCFFRPSTEFDTSELHIFYILRCEEADAGVYERSLFDEWRALVSPTRPLRMPFIMNTPIATGSHLFARNALTLAQPPQCTDVHYQPVYVHTA